MVNAGISLAMAPMSTDAPSPVPAAVDADAFQQLGDSHIEGNNVVADVRVLDVSVDTALRLYAPQPGNGRE